MQAHDESAGHENKEVKKLVRQLEVAATADIALNKEGKPALEKLLLLDTVYGKLVNKKLHQELLDAHLLSALRTWLEPLADNSFPPDEVKKAVLDILSYLQPDPEHLVESGIGKIVLFYSKNPYEKKGIQRQARALVLKWIEIAKETE